MTIKMVPIRSTVVFGDLKIKTPYVMSFSVTKTRNSISTFNVSLKILADELDGLNDNKVIIFAGEKGNEKKIFTGYVKSSSPSPCWDDPKYIVLNLTGTDILDRLMEEKYTRRQIARKNKWAVITGVSRKASKAGKFKLLNDEVIMVQEDFNTSSDRTDKTSAEFGEPPVKGEPRNVTMNFKVSYFGESIA